jgi:hypothetical protein
MACIGKVRYINEEGALAALDTIRNSTEAWQRRKVPKNVYECDVCRGWHLTSMDGPAPRIKPKRGVVRG